VEKAEVMSKVFIFGFSRVTDPAADAYASSSMMALACCRAYGPGGRCESCGRATKSARGMKSIGTHVVEDVNPGAAH